MRATSASPPLEPPLAGRLLPPRRADEAVPRPRLLRRLNTAAAEAPVILVRAPPGYGKSTLLAQFADADPRRCAWLSIEERDEDPVVLLHDLAHALGTLGAPDEELLNRLRVGASAVTTLALPRLMTSLAELAKDPLLIVLDDVHHLTSPAVLDVLQVLCDHTPPGCCLVLGGRARPKVKLGRLRAEGRLWELKTSDLRMTPGEGAEMLRRTGAEVDDEEAGLVVQRTEGWPAAIYLAAVVLRDGDRLGDDATLGPDASALAEYFREEVLLSAAADDAAFLVRSSILDELRPDICDAVLRIGDSDTRLRSLADNDLFVAPLDARGHAYHVHGLFREMLEDELHTDPALEQELHRRACAVYRGHEGWERAIRHAVAAGDVGIAADLMQELVPRCLAHGRSGTLKRWYSWLSDTDVAAHPHAALAPGWAAVNEGDVKAASDAAAIVLGGEQDRVLSDGATLGSLGLLLRASIGMQGLKQAVDDARGSLAALPAGDPRRSVSLLLSGSLAMLDGDFERAAAELSEAEAAAAGQVNSAYVLSLSQQALMMIEAGHWDSAAALVERAQAAQRMAGVTEYAVEVLAVAAHALTLAHRGDGARGRPEADRALRNLARLQVAPWLAAESRIVLARAYAKLGDPGQVRALLREGDSYLEGEPLALLVQWAARVDEDLERRGHGDAEGRPALTTAELRALEYLPTHLSLKEIGERLFITRNTVKTHTIAIYRKLGVTSRSEAVERGRELGLLDA